MGKLSNCRKEATNYEKQLNNLASEQNGKWSWGWISWDQNSTFSGGQIFNHEIKIQFVHEVKFV